MKTLVKTYRQRANLTQAQLARLVHVSARTIISIEKGQYNPSLMLAYRLACVFDVNVETLCCLAENMQHDDKTMAAQTSPQPARKDAHTMTASAKLNRTKQLIHRLYNSTTDPRLQAPLLKAYKRLAAGTSSDDFIAHVASAVNYIRLTNNLSFTAQQEADWQALRDLGSAAILHHDPKDNLLDLSDR